jgi:uncharacterized protein
MSWSPHDSGLLCFLLGLDLDALPNSPLLGSIWETFVFSELRKKVQRDGPAAPSIFFYRDAQGRELDFLRLQKGQLDLLECKWAEVPDPRWFQGLKTLSPWIGKNKSHPLGEQYLVCRTPSPHVMQDVRIISPQDL